MTPVLEHTHVIIATYGDDGWAERGDRLRQTTLQTHGPAAAEVIHSHASTLHEARNAGAADVPPMRWLCFLDADDELEPGYFEALDRARATANLSPVLLVPAVRYVHANGQAEEPSIPNTEPRRPLAEINTAVIGTLITSNLFAALGGFRDWPCYEDWDLWLRATGEPYRAQMIEAPDAIYRAHTNPRGRNRPDRRADDTYHAIRRDLGYE